VTGSPGAERGRPADVGIGLVILVTFVAAMWLAELADVPLNGDLNSLGINPREPGGLIGILFLPFLHTGFGHLAANTVPLLILGSLVALGGTRRLVTVTLIVWATSGLGIWAIADKGTLHLGASGIVFGYAAYLMARGFYTRRATHLLIGVAVMLTYGATVILAFEPRPGVSWQGHLFGALGGLLAAAYVERTSGQSTGARGPARYSP
jgi:membrane associated rhomboid family serine protease